MTWRALAGAAVCVAVALAAPAGAATSKRTATYYLDVFGGCVDDGYAVSRDATGSSECALLPRVAANGKSLNSEDPDFTLKRGDAPAGARLDATRPITGTFYAVIPGPNPTSPDLAGYLAADYSVRVDGRVIGTVHVEGATSAVAPAKTTFSLRIPAALNGKLLTSLVVSTTWTTCATPCATGVSGARHSTFVVPLR